MPPAARVRRMRSNSSALHPDAHIYRCIYALHPRVSVRSACPQHGQVELGTASGRIWNMACSTPYVFEEGSCSLRAHDVEASIEVLRCGIWVEVTAACSLLGFISYPIAVAHGFFQLTIE